MIAKLKALVIEVLAHIAWQTGRSQPEISAKDQLTVVTFHRVLPEAYREQYPYPGLAVTPEELDWFCRYFKKHYDCGSVTQQWVRLKNNELTAKPLLAISFDDGQFDNFEFAHPILEQHSLIATFYIPTKAVSNAMVIWHDRLGYAIRTLQKTGAYDVIAELAENHNLPLAPSIYVLSRWVEIVKSWRPERRHQFVNEAVERAGPQVIPGWGRLMYWDEIRMLQAHGHEIGSHSVNHHLMDQLDPVGLQYEIDMSARTLEAELGQAIRSFCYPNGNHDERCPALLEQAGYTNATTTQWGLNAQTGNPFYLLRCDIDAARFRNHRHKLSRVRTALRLAGLQPGLH